MSKLKVFVSSTCYDLSSVRSGLKRFIEEELGYEAVLSDQQDILYDPRIHTHTACIEEVKNSDLMILIIGSRFGGQATEEALDRIDFEGLKEKYPDIEEIERQGKISITQLEVLEAMRQAIPIFTFVVDKVYQDHLYYTKFKNTGDFIRNADFPNIEKKGTAVYIFGFIDFMRRRKNNNALFTLDSFESVNDLKTQLKKQWSGYFQRLLSEQRSRQPSQEQHRQTLILPRQEMHKRYLLDDRLHITDGAYKKISYIRLMNLDATFVINPEISDTLHFHKNDLHLSEAIETILRDSNARMELILTEPNSCNLKDIKTKIANQRAGSSEGALYSALATLYDNLSGETIYSMCAKMLPVRFQFSVMKVSIPFSIFNIEFCSEYDQYSHVLVDLYSAALTNEANRRSIMIWKRSDPENYQFFVNNFAEIKTNPNLCKIPTLKELKGWAEIWEKLQTRQIGG